MDLNQNLYLNEIQNIPSKRMQVTIIQQYDYITIVNCQQKEILKLYYIDEQVYFQWMIVEQSSQQQSEVLIWIKEKIYILVGNHHNIFEFFNICRVRFVFFTPNEMNISSQQYLSCNLDINHILQGTAYNINSQRTNFDSENDFQQKIIDHKREWILETPEEINIIKKLYKYKKIFQQAIHSIYFNGIHYTVYFNKKNCDSIKETLKQQSKEQFGLIINVVKQLLQMLDYFQEIKLVHHGLEIKNIFLDQEQKIQIFDFSSSFFEDNQPLIMKAQSIGCIPPECFQKKQYITTKSNIFKLGVMFFKMLFKKNPFGQDAQQCLNNNINVKLIEFQIQDLQLPNKINDKITMILMSMLNLEPTKRKLPKEYLQDELFQQNIKEMISKNSIKKYIEQCQSDEVVQQTDDETTQQIRSIRIQKK